MCPSSFVQDSDGSESLLALRTAPGRSHFCAYRNVSIAVWVGQADVPALRLQMDVTKEMSARNPGGYSSVHFILNGLPGPTPEAMPLLGKALTSRSEVACTAVVLEGEGFWASGLRSMLNNSHRQASSSLKMRIGTSFEALLPWFVEEHAEGSGVLLDPAKLREALLRARRIGEQTARG